MTKTAYDQYCVVRVQHEYFALPATDVREVLRCPSFLRLPNSSPVLAGLTHVGNEFLTITNPFSSVRSQVRNDLPQQLLVVSGPDGPWGVLVDEVVELAPLDDFQPTKLSEGGVTFSGSATHRGQRVRVMAIEGTYRLVMSELKNHWPNNLGKAETGQEVKS